MRRHARADVPLVKEALCFNWANFWATDAERDAGYAAYANASHAAKAMEDSTCQDPVAFDSRVIFAPQG